MKLAEVVGDSMKVFLRDVFGTILEGIKVPNKVMSGFVDDCIMHLIKLVSFKHSIPVITNEIKESKAKNVRERCLVRNIDWL